MAQHWNKRHVTTTLGLVAALLYQHRAEACSPVFTGWSANVPTSGPVDGVIGISLACWETCEDPPDLEVSVVDDQGNPVAGAPTEVRFSKDQGWFVWSPDAPLVPGASYEVHVSGKALFAPETTTYEVRVGASGGLPDEPLSFDLNAEMRYDGEPVCCDTGQPNTCGTSRRCFPADDSANAFVSLAVLWTDEEEAAGQYVLSGTVSTSKEKVAIEPVLSTAVEAVVKVTQPEDEYCYELTARHVVSGKETRISGCSPASKVVLPDVEAELLAQQRYGLRECVVAPPGYQSQWYEAFAPELEANSCATEPGPACENALKAQEQDAGGCSVTAGAGAPVVPGLLGLAAVVRALELRRRRRRVAVPGIAGAPLPPRQS